ncbi:WD40-repeat-containing domain protein, partial [Pilobolus umbonatus]
MSLFNKISGLALKARDNVVSKTFVSKDRRLEQSLSDKVDLAEIFFEKMSTYGLPSHIHVIAYDSVAGLLAVAGSSKQGYIKVFGKGISSTIPLPNQVGVKHLQFRTGSPTLVVIDNTNAIITLDLRSNSVQNVVMAPEIITSIEYCMGTDWLFIGYANGFVDVFDILQGVITQYQISDLLPEEDTGSHVVIDLKMHPSDLNTLLIGYESGAMIWSIKEKIVRKTFSLSKLDSANPFRKGRLTCFAWSPSGTRFIGGYDDGCIHLWDTRNDQKPACSRKLLQAQLATSPTEEDAANDTAADPIYQIAWYINESTHKSCVIVAGGIQSADICGLTLLEYDLDSEPKEPKKQTIIPLQDDLSQFLMLSSDPYYQGMYNPLGIAIIDVHGGLQVLNLIEHGYPLLKLPPAIEFLGPDVLNACHLPQIPDVTFRKLAQFTNADKETKYFPITGGLTGPDHVYKFESNDLLLTIHRGELVKFWDASFVALRPLSHLTIRCLDEVSTPQSFIRCLDLNKTTGHVSMGFNDGSIVLYKYRRDRFQPETNDPKIVTRNDLFINNCDDTLKDLNELLDGMDSTESVDDQGVHEHTPDVQQPPPEPPTDSKIFHKLQREGDSAGFYPSLKITL